MAEDHSSDERLKVTPPKQWATGVPGVIHAVQYSLEETSPRRAAVNLLSINQANGTDCPGCAWPEPDPKHRHINEYCENGAKHINDEATTRRITREFFREHSIPRLLAESDMWLNQQGRLTEPMVKRPGADHYEPISWDDALDLLSTHLRELDSPDEALFYTSGRVSNEAAFLLQLFARALGTNNLPDCSNMCHESSGSALQETLGIGKGTVSLDDIHEADLVFAIGINPGTNMPRMLSALEETKRNGGHVIAVNPLPEAGLIRFKNPQKLRGIIGRGTTIADQFLHIRPGGDLALFQALNALLLQAESAAPGTVLDRDFIDANTTGFNEFAEHVGQISWPEIEATTGLPPRRGRAGRRASTRQQEDHRLLGDGNHPAEVRGPDDPRNRQFPHAARQFGPPRGRRVPSARAQQRAGRPHDGDLGADASVVPGRSGARVRVHSPGQAWLGRGERHPCHARRSGQSLRRFRRQLRAGHSGQRSDRTGNAHLSTHRTCLHQAQPLPCRVRRDGVDPADSRPDRPRPAGHR